MPCNVNLLGLPATMRTIDGVRREIGGRSGREDAMLDEARDAMCRLLTHARVIVRRVCNRRLKVVRQPGLTCMNVFSSEDDKHPRL